MEVKNVPVPVNKLFDMGDPLARERANALIALQAGEIDYYEYSKKLEKIQRKQLLPVLEKAKIAGDWEGFINMALSIPELLKDAFKDFDKIPNQLKYDFAISAYTHHGDSIPAVRKAVRNALKYGRPTLPEYIRDKDIVTVYRAGEEDIQKAKYRISWTTNKEVAEFFLKEYKNRHANNLYEGKIRTKDIIAFTNSKNEFEVMQYGSVYDISLLNPAGGPGL